MTKWANKTRNGVSANKYHTNPNCRYLNRKKEVTDRAIQMKGLEKCSACSGELEHEQNQDHSIYEAAKRIGENRQNEAD